MQGEGKKAETVNCYRYSKLKEGDKFLVENLVDKRKHAPVFHHTPLTIISRQGNQVQVKDARARIYTRPLHYVKVFKFNEPLLVRSKTLDLSGFRANVFKWCAHHVRGAWVKAFAILHLKLRRVPNHRSNWEKHNSSHISHDVKVSSWISFMTPVTSSIQI